MQHKLTVAGTMPRESIPSVRGVVVKTESDGITFTAASEDDMKRLKRLLSLQLADVITREYEEKSLSTYIEKAHPYFLPGERQHILHLARLAMQKLPADKRTQYIENRLYNFLDGAENLSLEGFLNFRVKEYKALLKNTALGAVEAYLAEREYEEFITLLKYFVNTRPAGESVLHIVAKTNGGFSFFNCDGEPVEALYEELTEWKTAEMLTEEDLLLSMLITLAPIEITFHGVENLRNLRLLETVMKVFSGRVHVCEACSLCQSCK